MDLPVIPTPIFPRWVWMEEVTYSHIPIATLITAYLVMAPIFEYIGVRNKDPRFDRLAKSLVVFAMILYSPGAALGTGIPMFIIGLYPEFWHRFANLYFWPLIVQFIFFLCDVFFLFFGYYLLWDRLKNRRALHLFFGVMSAVFGLLIQAVWDSMATYQMTPGVALPLLTEKVGWSAAAFFNISYPYLFFHRFFGNISYSMLITGGVLALMYNRAKKPEDREYFGWASDLTFCIGFIAFFAMPLIGYGFASLLQQQAPVIFHSLMGGHTSTMFLIKMGLITFFMLIGGVHLFTRHKERFLTVVVSAGLVGIWVMFSLHPPLMWFGGSALAWRVAYTVGLAAVLAGFLWIRRSDYRFTSGKRWSYVMFVAGLAAFFTFGLGGFVKSRSRQPYSVYKEIQKPEATAYEQDRFLTYDKCLGCHTSMDEFADYEQRDWERRVALERDLRHMELSNAEMDQIVRYLKEQYP